MTRLLFASLLIFGSVLSAARLTRAQVAASTPVSTPASVTPLPAVIALDTADTRPRITGPLSLSDAVPIALKNSPVLRGAQAEIDMATAQVETAQANRKLTVSATTFATAGRENGPLYNTPGGIMPQNIFAVLRGPFIDQNLMLMLPLATGGRLKALARGAQAARAASAADFEVVKLDLALEIKSDYRQALLAQEMARVAQERQKATAERLRNDQAALAAGRVPNLYVLRDDAEDADAQQGITNSARDVAMALVMLRAAMGVQPDSDFTLADTLEVPTLTAPSNVLELARQQRPELLAAQHRLENARQGISAAAGNSRPQVALEAMADANRMRGGSGFGGGTSYGLVVGIPIFDGGLRRADRAAASAITAKVQADLDRMQLQIEREVTLAQLSLSAARQNVTTTQTSIDAATEAYRVATLRYESGRGTNAEVLDALAALTRARGNRVRALYEAQIAADQLNRALGVM